MQKPPGKTLVVGASYIALECAGFLHGLGYESKVMMRSIPLRGFDQDSANRVVEFMKFKGIPFLANAVPVSIERKQDKLHVKYKTGNSTVTEEVFDTVLFAIGRTSVAAKRMGLESIGVKFSPSGKIIVNQWEQTNIPHIYALGDCIEVCCIFYFIHCLGWLGTYACCHSCW